MHAEPVRDTLLDCFLDRFSFDPATHVSFYQAPNSGAQADKMYVIFDSAVAKKNLFTTFLGDHVAIAPSTPLQWVASRLVGNRFYVYFKRPLSNPTQLFSLYSGNTELML